MDIIRDSISNHNYFTRSVPAIHFDPHAEDFHIDPYPTYRMLQSIAPVVYWESGSGWLITGYSDVLSALRDSRFSNNLSDWIGFKQYCTVESGPAVDIKSKLLAINAVDRHQLLSLTSPFFSSENEQLRQMISDIVDETLHHIRARPGFDLVTDFSYILSIRIITRLAGIPEKYIAIVIRFVRSCIEVLDPSSALSSQELNNRISRINMGLELIKRTLGGRKFSEIDSSLIDNLINSASSNNLSESDLTSLIGVLLFSGLDCMMLFIATSVYAILRHPAAHNMLQENNLLWGSAVKEALRYDYFIKLGTPRYALEDCIYQDKIIRQGERVYPIIAAALRDPAAFEHPDEFNIARPMQNFIGFGHGNYSCIGQSLALLAAEIAARKLLEEMYPLSISDPPSYDLHHKTFRMMTSLKLTTNVPANLLM